MLPAEPAAFRRPPIYDNPLGAPPPAEERRNQTVYQVAVEYFRTVVRRCVEAMRVFFNSLRNCCTRCRRGVQEIRIDQAARRELRREHAGQIDGFEIDEPEENIEPPLEIREVAPAIIAHDAPIATKLAAYADIPSGDGFMQAAVNLHRAALRGEDALIPDDPGAAPGPKMLDNFNRLVTDKDAELFVSLLHISIRAFLFTNRTLAEHLTPDFLKKDYRRRDGWGFRNTYEDLTGIRERFRALPDNDKAIIFNTMETADGIDHLPLTAEGRAVLGRIGGIANELVQRNPAFNVAAQAVE